MVWKTNNIINKIMNYININYNEYKLYIYVSVCLFTSVALIAELCPKFKSKLKEYFKTKSEI